MATLDTVVPDPPAPDPSCFSTRAEWLGAALAARGEFATRAAAAGAGAYPTLWRVLHDPEYVPTRRLLGQLAAYFETEPHALAALLPVVPMEPPPPGTCACWCGGVPSPGKRFISGHHSRVMPLDEHGRLLRKTRVVCRGCDRTWQGEPEAARGYDAGTHTYLCRTCGKRLQVELRCPRCQLVRHVDRHRLSGYRSLRWTPDGATALCRPCGGHEAARKGRAVILATQGVSFKDDAATQRAAFRDFFARDRKRRDAPAPKSKAHLAVLAAGRAVRQQRGTSHHVRDRIANRLLAGYPRKGEFRVCPLCHCLVYLEPREIREERPGYHGECWAQWAEGPEFKEWQAAVGRAGTPLYDKRRAQYPVPRPHPPARRPPPPELLDQWFRWLVRHYLLQQSWGEIHASVEGWAGRSSIQKGVKAFIALLPARWVTVFGTRRAVARLDHVLPIERLRMDRRKEEPA